MMGFLLIYLLLVSFFLIWFHKWPLFKKHHQMIITINALAVEDLIFSGTYIKIQANKLFFQNTYKICFKTFLKQIIMSAYHLINVLITFGCSNILLRIRKFMRILMIKSKRILSNYKKNNKARKMIKN